MKMLEFSLEKSQSCSDLISANSKTWMNMSEWKMARIAGSTRVATSSSMEVKKLSLLKKGWATTKSTCLIKSLHPSIAGWLRFGHKQRTQTNLHNFSPCRLSRSKTELLEILECQLINKIKASQSPSTWLRKTFLLLFFSVLWIAWVTSIF